MQNSLSLNDLYDDYKSGLLERKKFEGAVFEAMRDNVRRYGLIGWNREDSDDYLSSLYTRISRAINTYQETGSSFETYIGTIARLTAKEYRSRQIRSYHEENAAWITQIPDMYACEHEAEYHEYLSPEKDEQGRMKNPRQLLILILKCCSRVSAEFLEKIAPQLDMEPDTLRIMIEHLLGERQKREEEIALMREKINRQFYRCILLEKKIKVTTENIAVTQRLRMQLERGRNRLARIRKQLARSRVDPSNMQIAKLLGISKGTVDSVLYNLKIRGAHPDIAQRSIG